MFAERFWPGRDPIGQGVRRGAARRLLTIVGVADDVRDVTLLQAPAPTLYLPFTQNNVAIAPVSLVVRMAGEPLASARAISAAVLEVDPAQPLDHVTTLDQFLSDSLGPQRFRSTLLLILSGLGLAMAGIGIYGVTSRAVGERTRELGVRLALGASAAGLARLVIWQALRAVLAGLCAGVLLAVPALVLLLKTLPNVEHAEPWAAVPVPVRAAGCGGNSRGRTGTPRDWTGPDDCAPRRVTPARAGNGVSGRRTGRSRSDCRKRSAR